MHPYDWIISGLALDLCGGLALAKGFVAKRTIDIWRDSHPYLGGSLRPVKSALHQKGEAVAGGSLLALGFLFQIWGTFHGAPQANDLGWINSPSRLALVLVLVVLVTVAALFAAHRWAKRRVLTILGRHYTPTTKPINETSQGEDLDTLAWLLYTRRKSQETDGALRDRLNRRRQGFGKKYGGRETEIP